MADVTSSPAQDSGDDLVSVIRADHEEIRSLFAEVESATAAVARSDAFARLVRKLAVHEVAEEEVVRPTIRAAGGGDVADRRNREESRAKTALAQLERLGPDAPQFPATLEAFRIEVLAHADREEQEEHPILQAESPDRLRALAGVFRAAEAVAPTHPHPHGPESAIGNMVVGPAVAVVDRVRDALRDAMQKVERI